MIYFFSLSKILLIELSGQNPLNDFEAWFFGSLAVVFVALLIYNLYEMKNNISNLTKASIYQGKKIAVLESLQKQEVNLHQAQTRLISDLNTALENLNRTVNQINRKVSTND